jgi:hypothetical protein
MTAFIDVFKGTAGRTILPLFMVGSKEEGVKTKF